MYNNSDNIKQIFNQVEEKKEENKETNIDNNNINNNDKNKNDIIMNDNENKNINENNTPEILNKEEKEENIKDDSSNIKNNEDINKDEKEIKQEKEKDKEKTVVQINNNNNNNNKNKYLQSINLFPEKGIEEEIDTLYQLSALIELEKEKEKEEIEKKLIEEQNKKNSFVNISPIATDEFTLEMEYNNILEVKDTINIGFNDETLDIENMQFSIDSIPKEVSEQGIQIEEEKPKKEEKDTDTFDLEKKEIKITHKKILKKTNVLRHEFRNNSICSDTKININKTSNLIKDRNNNVINKTKCFTINQIEKGKDKDNKK